MKVIEPVPYQTSHLLSTTATELYSNYSAGTTYALGARVMYLNYYWESLIASNTGNTPDTNPTKWLKVAPSNPQAMFDNSISTSTVQSSPLTFVIKPGRVINSISILGIVGTEVVITVKDAPAGNVVYTRTINLDGSIITNWYEYFFEPFDIKDTVVLTDIPPYANCTIEVTLNGSGDVSIGNFIYGNSTIVGLVQYGVGFGIRDYSIKDTDDFGNTIFVKRAYSRRMEPDVLIENSRLAFITRKLDNLRATPTVWVGSEDSTYSPLVVFGYYRDYDIAISYPVNSLLRLSIEGLT